MNWTQVEGKWDQLRADVKTKWGKLTDDDFAYVRGQRDRLVGKLEERYGVLHDSAQKDVDEWSRGLPRGSTGLARPPGDPERDRTRQEARAAADLAG